MLRLQCTLEMGNYEISTDKGQFVLLTSEMVSWFNI